MNIANEVSSAVGVKASESHLKDAESKTGKVTNAANPVPAATQPGLEPVTLSQVLGPKVASVAPTGEVTEAQTPPQASTPESNADQLLGSIGNAKKVRDALAPIAKPILPVRDTRVPKPSSVKGFPKNGKPEAKDNREKEKRDPETMPGMPGDASTGNTDFGAREGDAIASLTGGIGSSKSDDDKKSDKDKNKDDKQPTDEQRRLEEQLASALNGQMTEQNYNTVADQILNNRSFVKDQLGSNATQRANAINLIRKFAPQDRNKARGQDAMSFATSLEESSDPDAAQPRQLAPRRDGIHNQ